MIKASSPPLRIAVLVASYNRVEITLRGLRSLREGASRTSEEFHYFLLDDASPDKTAERVADSFPDVQITLGNGELYWSGGMRAAHEAARCAGPFDAYLMFNDDVVVDPAEMPRLIEAYRNSHGSNPTIWVGRTVDDSGCATYGGVRRTSRHLPLRVEQVRCGTEPTPCDSFHGNFVLVPATVLDTLGIDPCFIHQYGDIDLGFTAQRMGVRSMVWPQPIGLCEGNVGATMPEGNLLKRLRLGLSGRNGFHQHAHFILKHSPSRVLAIPVVLLSFAKRLASLALGRPPPATTDVAVRGLGFAIPSGATWDFTSSGTTTIR